MSLIDKNNFDTIEARNSMLNAEYLKENNKIEDKDDEYKMNKVKKKKHHRWSVQRSIQ